MDSCDIKGHIKEAVIMTITDLMTIPLRNVNEESGVSKAMLHKNLFISFTYFSAVIALIFEMNHTTEQ